MSLSELLRSVVADARFEAEAEGKDIELAIDADPELEADPELLHRGSRTFEMPSGIHPRPQGRSHLGSVPRMGPGSCTRTTGQAWPRRTCRGCSSRSSRRGLADALGLASDWPLLAAIERHGGRIEAANCPDGGLAVTMQLGAGASGAASAER
ncbi:MAG: hypothetical protein R3E48_02385 [Burkholderiaceae bacterium]